MPGELVQIRSRQLQMLKAVLMLLVLPVAGFFAGYWVGTASLFLFLLSVSRAPHFVGVALWLCLPTRGGEMSFSLFLSGCVARTFQHGLLKKLLKSFLELFSNNYIKTIDFLWVLWYNKV